MKFLYLVRNQFSKNLGRELLLILQIVAMVSLMAPVTTSVATLLSVGRLAWQITRPALFVQAESRYLQPDGMDQQVYMEALNRPQEIEGVLGVGRMAVASGSFEQSGAMIRFYNPVLAQNIKIPLRSGSQSDTAENGYIPLLINENMAKKYRIGDSIPGMKLYFPVSREYIQMDFVVAGVMDSNGYFYSFLGGGSTIDLNALGARNSISEHQAIALLGFDRVPALDVSASCLVFVSEDSRELCSRINGALTGIGIATQLSVMRQNSIRAVVQNQPMIFLAAMLMILLCLMGSVTYTWLTTDDFIGQFSMYYICGMTWRRGFIALLVTQMVPVLLSIPIAALAVQLIPLEISLEGMQMALLLVLPMTLFCILLLSFRFRTVNPILLLRESE